MQQCLANHAAYCCVSTQRSSSTTEPAAADATASYMRPHNPALQHCCVHLLIPHMPDQGVITPHACWQLRKRYPAALPQLLTKPEPPHTPAVPSLLLVPALCSSRGPLQAALLPAATCCCPTRCGAMCSAPVAVHCCCPEPTAAAAAPCCCPASCCTSCCAAIAVFCSSSALPAAPLVHQLLHHHAQAPLPEIYQKLLQLL